MSCGIFAIGCDRSDPTGAGLVHHLEIVDLESTKIADPPRQSNRYDRLVRLSTAYLVQRFTAAAAFMYGVVTSVLYFNGEPETRHTTFPTSSATSSAPRVSIATPTGRPIASPFSLTNPVSTSIGMPAGLPSLNGTKITL